MTAKHTPIRAADALPATGPVHRGKDLRIPNTTPEQLAKTLLRGGARPRIETKRQ